MKPLGDWNLPEAAACRAPEQGRKGHPTLIVDGLYLHSRYDPIQEGERLTASAALDPEKGVLVVGLGLGYHLRPLLAAGMKMLVYEPDADIARAARDTFPELAEIPMVVGPLSEYTPNDAFNSFAAAPWQSFEHPPTLRRFPEAHDEMTALLGAAALQGQRLNVAITGPLYGGSLPIAGYLADAFRCLGHNTLLVSNDTAWPLYESMTKGLKSPQAGEQLGNLFGNALAEWTYARVAEFDPEICIVLAQSPVNANFAARLAKRGTVTAFWFVENWRHLSYWRDYAPRYDAFFHIQPGAFEAQLDEAGSPFHAFIQTGCDPEQHRPLSLSDDDRVHFGCDLSFAGAGYYNRLQLFKGLTDYDFKIWGVDWHERELAPKVVGGEQRFDSETFMKIVAGSKINLNLHSSAAHDGVDPACDAVNPRVFEIAAAGGFQLCDPCQGLASHFDLETEIPAYRSLAELRERIDYYLAHDKERRAVAAAAQQRALAEHTYEHRAQQMLDLLLRRYGHRIQQRGVRVQRDIREMLEKDDLPDSLREWLEGLPPERRFSFDELRHLVQGDPTMRSEGEQIFSYMREVHDFAEMLLREQR